MVRIFRLMLVLLYI